MARDRGGTPYLEATVLAAEYRVPAPTADRAGTPSREGTEPRPGSGTGRDELAARFEGTGFERERVGELERVS